VPGIEEQVAVTNQGQRLGQAIGVRQLVPASCSAPQTHQGADSDVEGAAAACGKFLCGGQNLKQVFADLGGRATGSSREPHQFAVRFVIAHGVIQGGDAVKGGAGSLLRRGCIRSVKHDTKHRAHVGLGEGEAMGGLQAELGSGLRFALLSCRNAESCKRKQQATGDPVSDTAHNPVVEGELL